MKEIVCGGLSWEMALNIGHDTSLNNICDWEEVREKAGRADSTRVTM
jgi:hypothetical protein